MDHVPHLRRGIAGAVAAVVLVAASGAAARPGSTVLLRIHTDGVVVGVPGGFRCAGRCAIPLERGTIATLHALHRKHFAFSHWTGDCVGSSRTCAVALDRTQSVRTEYEGDAQVVELTVGGPGVVRSSPNGIVCGGTHDACSAEFPWGTRLRLRTSGAFGGWGGACWNRARGACTLKVRRDTQVTAAFGHRRANPKRQLLKVRTQGPRVRSVPLGIDCPGTCRATFAPGTRVTLRVSDAQWSGACTGEIDSRCALVLDAPTTVDVNWKMEHGQQVVDSGYGLNVTVSGKGTVTAPGIKCGGVSGSLFECENFFDLKDTVVLRANPGKNAQFAGWNQFCKGTKPVCTLHVAAPMTVGAVFRR